MGKRTRPISQAEYRALLRVLDIRTELAVRISADTGLRVSDVLLLPREGLKRSMVIVEQKTGKRRRVHLAARTFELAQDYTKRHKGEYLIPCNRSTIYRHLKEATQLLGMPPVSMHSLRKYYARKYCKRFGWRATQEELQHDSPNTTALYLLEPDAIGKILDSMNF